MKKAIGFIAGLVFAGAALAAYDASTLVNETILAARAQPESYASKALITYAAFTTNSSNVSTLQATSNYYGKAQLVIIFSGNADAAYTNDVTIKQGAVTATNTVATYGHTGAGLNVYVYELDFTNNVTLAKWSVEYAAVTDNSASYSIGVYLVYPSLPTAATVINSSAYDRQSYVGTAAIVVSLGSAKGGSSSFSGTVAIQDSLNGSTGWTNVTGASTTITGASGGIGVIPFDCTGSKRYIRAVVTTTNDIAPACITINGYQNQ